MGRRTLACIEHHTFLSAPLAGGGNVIDAGANLGVFCSGIVSQFHGRVIAVEPHPGYFGRIATGGGIEKLRVAIAAKDGPLTLRLDENLESSRIDPSAGGEGIIVEGRSLESLADELGMSEIALIKMDIEGAELDVLDSLSDAFLARVAQFTVEFHDFAGYASTPRVEQTLDRLEKRGFAAIKFSRSFYGDTLIANIDRCQLSKSDLWWLRNVSRTTQGMGRWIRRKVMGPKKANP
jgi:FkbM family methyltransferase